MSSNCSTLATRLQKSLIRLEKELRLRSRAIDEAALRVISCGRIAESREPGRYSSLHGREMYLLTEASKVEQRRCLRTLRIAKKSRLGTLKRLNTLKSFIYETEHYLIPVLERVSPDAYKSALNQIITEAVNEYSTWVNDFDQYIARSILQIVARAERLGIPAPEQVRKQCEKALSLTTNKLFESLEILSEAFWDSELKNRVIETFGDRSLADPSLYDPLLMTISKIPERRIRQMLETSDPNANVAISGGKLLDVAQKKGLFGAKESLTPTFFVVKGYLAAIRNQPHHDFVTPPFQRVVDSIFLTNQVLKLIDAENGRT